METWASPREDRTGCRSRYRRYIQADVILVPGEDSSTGNVTGGLRLARCVLGYQAAANSTRSISVASSVLAFELLTRGFNTPAAFAEARPQAFTSGSLRSQEPSRAVDCFQSGCSRQRCGRLGGL